MIKLKYLLALLLTLLLVNGQAQVSVSYKILKDSTHLYQPEDVISMRPDNILTLENPNLNLGLTESQYWVIAEITNTDQEMFTGKLVIDYPLLREIKFFEICNNELTESTPALSSHAYIYNVKTAANSQSKYLLQINGNTTPGIIPIHIDDTTNVLSDELTHTFRTGSFYGIIIFLFFIILFINFSTNENFFRLLLLYLLVTILYFGISDGFVARLQLNSNIDFQFQLALILLPLLVLTYERFQHQYFTNLNIDKQKKSTSKLFYLITAIVLLIVISGLLPYKYNFSIVYAYNIIALAAIVAPIVKIRNLRKTAFLTIIISVTILELGFIVELLHKTGLLSNSFITLNALKIAFVLHVSTSLLGAVERFQGLKKELSTFSLQLSELVEEKTAEINQQNEELKVQTEQLELQKEELESQKEELQTQKEILEEQNVALEQLNLAASNTENVIYIFDPKGTLLWFNDSFSSQLGMSYNAFRQEGKNIDIRDISSYEKISEVVENVISTVKSVSYEAQLKSDTENKWYQTTLTPVLEENQLKYIVAIDSDITRLKNYEQEIIAQQQEFEMQKNLAIDRRKEVEAQQREITDSLTYAKRIQSAILPSSKSISRFFPESFVLFMPRDIVSGDFYWFHRIEDKYICVVIDCTGHGVPGAFMSIIGTYLLNNIIIQNNETRPAEILKQLNRKLKISLKNSAIDSQTNDGMDVALVVIDKTKDTLTFAGALRPLFLFQNGAFIEQKGDKTPITSAIAGNNMATFNEYTYNITDGDVFYIFTDGIVDQFGGQKNKKFLTKRLKQVIFDAQMYPLEEQKRIIQKSIINWRGKNQQVDDILIMGIKV